MRFAERAWARRLKSARRRRADRNLSVISGTNRVRVPMREKNASMYFHYSPVYSQFILYLYLIYISIVIIYAEINVTFTHSGTIVLFLFFHLFTKVNQKWQRFEIVTKFCKISIGNYLQTNILFQVQWDIIKNNILNNYYNCYSILIFKIPAKIILIMHIVNSYMV